ncbi:Alpha-mannosidase I MNS4 [Linum perenne]
MNGQKSYPLRPELIESTYWLYKATRDPRYLDAGRDMVASLQNGARCPCGYCHITDVESHQIEDHMESFFLAETVKYLWLLFDLACGADNLVENGPYKYIFSTEGHLLPATPQIALAREHCSYFGAYCKSSDVQQESCRSETSMVKLIPTDLMVTGSTEDTHQSCLMLARLTHQDFPNVDSLNPSGLIKGLCPGLTHGQRYGISYADTTNNPASEKETVADNPPLVLISDLSTGNSMSFGGDDDAQKSSQEEQG